MTENTASGENGGGRKKSLKRKLVEIVSTC
jgi:hypothetical protein